MGDLASQIGNAHLRTAAPAPKKVEARTDLMNMIRQGKKLRSAQDRVLSAAPVPAAKSGPAALSVADILSRRIAVADSDDEDDDDDDDEWDD